MLADLQHAAIVRQANIKFKKLVIRLIFGVPVLLRLKQNLCKRHIFLIPKKLHKTILIFFFKKCTEIRLHRNDLGDRI